MLDIINKNNAFIAAASVLLVFAFMLVIIGGVTMGQGYTQHTFEVRTLDDGAKTLVATIDGKEVTPQNLQHIELTGESMTLWYSPVTNSVLQSYTMQSWGCLGGGLASALIGAIILIRGFRKKKVVA